MNCTATLLRATQTVSAAGASGPRRGEEGADGATPAKPFSAVLAEDARLPGQTAALSSRETPADPNPNAKANATAKSGAAKSAQDSNASGLSSRNRRGQPALHPTAQTPQDASPIPVRDEKSGNSLTAPQGAHETTGANAPAAEFTALTAAPRPPAAQDSTNAAAGTPDGTASAENAAPAGNAAPQSGMGTLQPPLPVGPNEVARGGKSALTLSSSAQSTSAAGVLPPAQGAQPGGAEKAPAQSPGDSSAQAEQAGENVAVGKGGAALSAAAPAKADSAASENFAQVASGSDQPDGTELLFPTADPGQAQGLTARGEKGVGTATDVAQPDPLQRAEETRPGEETPDFSMGGNSGVPQPASGSAGTPASATAPNPASEENVISRLLAPRSGADPGTQLASGADQGFLTAGTPRNPAQTRPGGAADALPTAAQPQQTTQDADSRVGGNDGATGPAAGKNSLPDDSSAKPDASASPADAAMPKTASSRAGATGTEEGISDAISSPWNDATGPRDEPERILARPSAKSATQIAESSFLTVAPAMEPAALDSSGKPSNTSGGLNEAQFLGNIVRQASLLRRPDGASELTLSLQPPELGTVVVRLTLKDDHLQGQLQVDSQSVRENLESLIPAVKQSLAGEGINLDRLDVGVRGQGGQAAGQDSSGGRQASQARRFSPRGGDPRSESGTRGGTGVSAVGGVLSTLRTSAWPGVMDFVA